MKLIGFVIILFSAVCTFAQQDKILMHPNRGQWDTKIDYQVEMQQGTLLINGDGFTYFLNDAMSHEKTSDAVSADGIPNIHCQVVKHLFQNVTWAGVKEEKNPSSFYRNYFLGKDEKKWQSKVYSYSDVNYKNYYPGIDFQLAGGLSQLKYSFIVQPGADASLISSKISGSKSVIIKDGKLIISTDFGDIIEEKPIAWTEKEGKRTNVKVNFVLKNGILSYDFPAGYDHAQTLVIDPNIVFSSFTGSTMDNWGMTAAPDNQGNLYAGGIVFAGSGTYPFVTGSFDATFNQGNAYSYTFNGGTFNLSGFDAAISKFNATGTSLMFSTYLGGTGNEAPHSLVTDAQDNLYVFGVTGSTDFPTVTGSYDITHNGGPFVATNELGYYGADMYVCRFNAAGSALVGSTFLGGSDTDGINAGALFFNYGDPFRGEIIVNGGFVYLTSSTSSSDFPTVSAFQNSLNGPQDIVVLKMNTGLTTILWSTYLGGSGHDSGNGLALASNGNVYVSGGTTSSNMPFNTGYDLTYNGGISDGYLLRLSNTTGALLSGTYVGTSEYDQNFFVQLDNNDAAYIYGQSEGDIPITSGCYGVMSSGQFVMKFNTNLSAQIWSTAIGSGSGHIEISPTAFLVSNCNDIYLAGWGGIINTSYSPGAINSTTNNLPVTSDAYQSGTNGSNFWLAVLSSNAQSLKYATFIGGTSSSYNHVDGGTSRFDKDGNVYHAVCGACGGQNNGFSVTPGAWATQNPSPNCNLAAFKFELSSIEAIVSSPAPLICLPNPVIFNNNSSNGNNFFWNFGDSNTSTQVNPSHVYAGPGQYTVTLIVSDTAGCYTPDTVSFVVNIGDFNGGIVEPLVTVCPGQGAQLEAYGGATYLWSPANLLSNPNISNPIATVTQNTVFTCIISDSCGIDTVQAQVNLYSPNLQLSNDTIICIGESVPLHLQGVQSFTWSPTTYLDDPLSLNPISTPDQTITYVVNAVTADGCQLTDQITITVVTNVPIPEMPDTLTYCVGSSATVTVSGGDTYSWSPPNGLSTTIGPTVTVSTNTNQYYYCDFGNSCGFVRDSMYVQIRQLSIVAGNDTIVCPGEPVIMNASGALSYVWSPIVQNILSDGSLVRAFPNSSGIYTVIGTDEYGCTASDFVTIDLYPAPFVNTIPDIYAIFGETAQLGVALPSSGLYVWTPEEFLNCNVCLDPIADVYQTTVFTVTYTDLNGCKATDDITVHFDPLIYVPNTYTPNGDGMNEDFFAVAANVSELSLEIFNRWGELIYTGGLLDKAWDGTYKGLKCQDGVYVWKIKYSVIGSDFKKNLVGHVSLLR